MAKSTLLKLKIGESVYITANYNSGKAGDIVYRLTKKAKVRGKDTYQYQQVMPVEKQKSPRLYKDNKHIQELRDLNRVKVLPKDYKPQTVQAKSLPHFRNHDWFKAIKTGRVDMALFTSNCSVSPKGNGVLGAGLAKEVQNTFLKMKVNTKQVLGRKLKETPVRRPNAAASKKMEVRFNIHQPDMFKLIELTIKGHTTNIYNFPVKEGFWEGARMSMIKASCQQAVKIANEQGYKVIILNFPGIGNGKLAKRYKEIHEVLCHELDDRFTILQKPTRKEVK